MNKIPTIFDRDWEGNRGVVDLDGVGFHVDFTDAIPTEKLDGTNVRLTVRNGELVRLEKRRNPSKIQKHKGIVDPWYVDAIEGAPEDKHIWEAARFTVLTGGRNHWTKAIPDGEWWGEAMGPKIQGNPLGLDAPFVYLISLPSVLEMLERTHVPTEFEGLRVYLPQTRSVLSPDVPIEGIVWHWPDGSMAKIKTKDFK